jgi:hypothetical protein
MSAGIILIRYLSLPMVKREAERRGRQTEANQLRADPADADRPTSSEAITR